MQAYKSFLVLFFKKEPLLVQCRQHCTLRGLALEETDEFFGFLDDGQGEGFGLAGAFAEDGIERGGVAEEAAGFGGDGGEFIDQQGGEVLLEGGEAFAAVTGKRAARAREDRADRSAG